MVLREVVSDNFKVSRDFFSLKAKLLKKERLLYGERGLQFGSLDQHYSYEESVHLVKKAFQGIHPKFVEIFEEHVSCGHVDVYPGESKTGGAYCMPGAQSPVYVMLNHTGSIRSVSTLAHEMGHAIHATLAKRESPLNYGHPFCTAETASTFCEDFVFQELFSGLTKKEQLVMIMENLQDKINTVFRQVAAYNFEFDLHNAINSEGYLSHEYIGKLFNKHMKSYMGKSITFDEDSARGWVYWSHFRRPFYVYSYAMGLLCAQSMQRAFSQEPEFKDKIIKFYSTGSSQSPEEIFASIGMDITSPFFWEQGVQQIKDLLKKAKKLAKELGHI